MEDLRRQTVIILDHKFMTALVFFMTLWALFMDDLQACTAAADGPLSRHLFFSRDTAEKAIRELVLGSLASTSRRRWTCRLPGSRS